LCSIQKGEHLLSLKAKLHPLRDQYTQATEDLKQHMITHNLKEMVISNQTIILKEKKKKHKLSQKIMKNLLDKHYTGESKETIHNFLDHVKTFLRTTYPNSIASYSLQIK
jgi:hypothetical protein